MALASKLAYDGTTTTVYTTSNGSANTEIDSGNNIDYSATNTDWASHGIMAKSGNFVGAATITLDEYLVGLDLIVDEERAVVIRNRSCQYSKFAFWLQCSSWR